jgi:hypothetical protein
MLVLCLLASTAGAASEMPGSIADYRAQSQQALAGLSATEQVEGFRDQAILAVVQAADRGLAERTLESLAEYRERHPDDLYAKMYEGYGWLFTAGEYVKKQNYFRAAELAKRGFFLIDEAVDERPDDWRLRYLRARMDIFVPAEFGRHVVALKDLGYLAQASEVPAELGAIIDFLQVKALTAAHDDSEAERLAAELARRPLWGELLAQYQGRLFLTREEIRHVLAPIVETDNE